MRFLILAHCDDDTALRVYTALKARHGEQQVKLVCGEELVFAPHWAHRLDSAGVTTELLLSDGTPLCSASLGVVFNRLRYVTMPHFAGATEEDRQYVVMEMQALWLSWLASLPCPVVNPVTPIGLGVQQRSQAEWLYLAGKAGLPTRGYHVTTNSRRFPVSHDVPYSRLSRLPNASNNRQPVNKHPEALRVGNQAVCSVEALSEPYQSILVAGKSTIGSLASIYRDPLRQLVALIGCDLLQVSFAYAAADTTPGMAGERWKVCGINSFPQVSTQEEIAALVALLESKQADVKR